jgi:hypothetical protein
MKQLSLVIRGVKILVFSLLIMFTLFSFREKESNTEFPKTASYSANFIIKWLDLHLDMIKFVSGYTPPVASRTIGYTYLALYESVVPGMPDKKSLNGHFAYSESFPLTDSTLEYYWPASASAALAQMLRNSFPLAPKQYKNLIDSLENFDSLHFAQLTSNEVLKRSFQFGRKVAEHISAYAAKDGAEFAFTRNYPSNYTAPIGPGLWVPTPAPMQPVFHYKSAMQPFWGNNRPFLYANVASSLILPLPPTYSTDTASYFYQEAKAVYSQVQNNSAAEKELAIFWADDVGSYSPPGHSIAICKIILSDKNANLALASEVLAKIGIGVSDAFINCFKNKYIFNLLRPVTYIRNHIDPNWNTLIGTPPFPEYVSCHSTQSAAAARILTHYFGENVSFTDNSKDDVGYTPRNFNNFYEFAQEAAISRFYGGVHYNFSCSLGYETGLKIGDNVINLDLKK